MSMSEHVLWSVLKTCRENRGLSQAEAARRFRVKPAVVSKWESGGSGITEQTLLKVAAAYKLGVRELLLEGLAGSSPERQAADVDASWRRAQWDKTTAEELNGVARTATGLQQLIADLGGTKAVAERLGITRQAVAERARRLGLGVKKRAAPARAKQLACR